MDNWVEKWLFDPVVGRIVISVVGLIVIGALVRLTHRALRKRVKDSDLRHRVRKGISILGYVVGILFLTFVYSDQLGSLTVAFGVAGAGIAFAMQEVIVSVAGWVAISFGQFYRHGDRVQLGGTIGDVIDIGVLRTTLMELGQWVDGDLYNGRIVRIANSFVFKEPVFNYSADFPYLWDEIKVPIKYGSDHRLARAILRQVADEVCGPLVPAARQNWDELVDKFLVEHASVNPLVMMIANDNWIEFTVRYVVDFKRRRSTKDRLFVRILDKVATSEGKVALASATFHLVETPVLDVRIAGSGRPAARD